MNQCIIFFDRGKPNSLTISTPPQFLAIHNSHLGSCVKTIGESLFETRSIQDIHPLGFFHHGFLEANGSQSIC